MHPWSTERAFALFIVGITLLAIAVSVASVRREPTTTTRSELALPTAEVRR